METLFRPSHRWEALLLENPDRREIHLPQRLTEVELLPHLTPPDVWATGVTWKAFCCFILGKMVWMTPYVYVASQCISNPADQTVLRLGGDAAAGSRLNVHVTKGRAPPAATDSTCDFLLRLLATSELPSVYINGRQSAVPPPLSGQVLSHFFQETRTCLGKVLLDCMILNEDQCLALTTMSRFDVEVNISNCSLVDDAAGAFIECLQCDRGPVELIHCHRESRSPA
jgi:hypothetical protein